MAEDMEFDLDSGEEVLRKPVADENIVSDAPDNEHTDDEHDPLGDERIANSGSDEELDNAADDDEREVIRERRRLERKNRKQAQREREDTLRRELASRDAIINELRQKVDIIEQRNSGSELAQLENGKREVARAYNFFKDQIRIAGEAGNHAAVAEATEKMIQSQRKFDELTRIEQTIKQAQSAPQPLDPRLATHAKDWMTAHPWYNPRGSDQDSEIVLGIDKRMAKEGWDPTTRAYWDELSARVKKYLPHRANRDKITARPKSVVTGGEREVSAGNVKTYTLSAERVQALKDAGMWDDPKQRAEMIKRYREQDAQQAKTK